MDSQRGVPPSPSLPWIPYTHPTTTAHTRLQLLLQRHPETKRSRPPSIKCHNDHEAVIFPPFSLFFSFPRAIFSAAAHAESHSLLTASFFPLSRVCARSRFPRFGSIFLRFFLLPPLRADRDFDLIFTRVVYVEVSSYCFLSSSAVARAHPKFPPKTNIKSFF